MKRLSPFFVLFLSMGCATWSVPNETADVLPPKKWAAGAAIGTTPGSDSREQNFPAQNSAKTRGTFFFNGRLGLTDGWEASLEGSYLFATASIFPRVRKQWWHQHRTENETSSVASAGIFYGFSNLNDTMTYNGVTYEHEKIMGVSVSNSLGILWQDGFQIFAGPRISYVSWSADYGTVPVSTSRTWNGFIPGGFTGVAYKFKTGQAIDFQADVTANLLIVPVNLSGTQSALWPGFRLGLQIMEAQE